MTTPQTADHRDQRRPVGRLKGFLYSSLTTLLILAGSTAVFQYARAQYWDKHYSPYLVLRASDYFKLRGEPLRIMELQSEGKQYFEIYARQPSSVLELMFAPVSDPPRYLYTADGELVDFTAASSDDPLYAARLRTPTRVQISIEDAKRKLGV